MAYYDPLAFQQQQQQQQQQLLPQQSGFVGDLRSSASLWMGELEPWMDENWIRGAWYSAGEHVAVKMIRDKYTGASAGYCFVELSSPAAAAKAISTLNGVLIPGTSKIFKLNWASGGNMGTGGAGQEYSLFVGDLSPEVTEYMLVATFQERYVSCRSAKIMTDPATGMSRGYGFVRFSDESEQLRALHEMQGVYCGCRPIRVSMATPKNKAPMGGIGTTIVTNMNGMGMATGYGYTSPVQPTSPQHALNQFTDPNNTTVFVGGLSGVTHEDELRGVFAPYGEITYVKIPPGKGCGFVQFVHRQSAEMAINQLNGYQIGNSRIRLSWGRAQNEPKPLSPHAPSMMAASFRPPMGPQFGYGQGRGPTPFGSYPGHMPGSLPGMMQTQSPRDPMERIPVEHQNRAFMERKEGLMERMDQGASWRGSGAIYA
ncbi:MAG: hypothetical protein J3Q66DRAFT_161032 [Benniella sp.]|nr:MAG: hypothetical protein J3Q66DRAFT_161032 [Benniella sp.]